IRCWTHAISGFPHCTPHRRPDAVLEGSSSGALETGIQRSPISAYLMSSSSGRATHAGRMSPADSGARLFGLSTPDLRLHPVAEVSDSLNSLLRPSGFAYSQTHLPGCHRLLQTDRPRFAHPKHRERDPKVHLRHRPLEWHPFARFLL